MLTTEFDKAVTIAQLRSESEMIAEASQDMLQNTLKQKLNAAQKKDEMIVETVHATKKQLKALIKEVISGMNMVHKRHISTFFCLDGTLVLYGDEHGNPNWYDSVDEFIADRDSSAWLQNQIDSLTKPVTFLLHLQENAKEIMEGSELKEARDAITSNTDSDEKRRAAKLTSSYSEILTFNLSNAKKMDLGIAPNAAKPPPLYHPHLVCQLFVDDTTIHVGKGQELADHACRTFRGFIEKLSISTDANDPLQLNVFFAFPIGTKAQAKEKKKRDAASSSSSSLSSSSPKKKHKSKKTGPIVHDLTLY